jgi:hypothetical protein
MVRPRWHELATYQHKYAKDPRFFSEEIEKHAAALREIAFTYDDHVTTVGLESKLAEPMLEEIAQIYVNLVRMSIRIGLDAQRLNDKLVQRFGIAPEPI